METRRRLLQFPVWGGAGGGGSGGSRAAAGAPAVAMVPSKCRPAAAGGGRPGHGGPTGTYGLQLVLQSTVAAERTKPLEFRLHKDQPCLSSRFLQHESERNNSGKLDGRLSPLSRTKKLYAPVTTNFADIPGLDMKYGTGPLSSFGECYFPNPSKYRIQQGCHNASPNMSDIGTYGNIAFPLVHRTPEEKMQYSDRLTFERQKLTVCPVIDGEEHLRLLSFQHNCITRIQNVSNLQQLIFLDLYDNQIEEISGLSALRSLRVLLLGNNRIRRISNLDNLISLDVLDLHGNEIAVIENLKPLGNLRVLNLARNCLTYAENLTGLDSLIELNLRYNQIRFVKDVDTLPCLQRLFLSFNNISCFDDILCLADSASLSDVTLDGNPIAQETWYRPTVLHHMMQLRQLDMKKITEEERRVASVALRKEEEKRRESHRQTLLKEKKRLTISNIARQWETQQNRFALLSSEQESKESESCQSNRTAGYTFPEENSFDDILCLADSASLSDVTLDGNPIAQETWYRPTVLHHMMQLRQLDMKKITEEERRVASVALRKEEEKRRESHRQTLLKEKKRLTISNIARQWETQQNRFALLSSEQESKETESCQSNRTAGYTFPEENRSLDSLLNKAAQGLVVLDSHLVEIEGDTLYLYGSGALESLDRNWSVQTAGSIAVIAFIFLDFDEIVPVLPKLKMKFPNSLHLKFKETNLVVLQQFNALAQLRRLEQLTVDPQGNPVVTFTLWKYYVLFRLSHFNLQKINGIEITQNDIIMAERLFGVLEYVATSDVPYCRLLTLLGDCRKKQLCYFLEAKGKKLATPNEDNNDRRKLGGENASRLTLNYCPKDSQAEKLEEAKDRKNVCHAYIQDLVKEASDINLKNERLQKIWPQMFVELVRDAVIEICNKDSYRKLCLQRIVHQKS